MAKLTGLDVDVANALARVLAVRTNIVPTEWYQLESGLVEGRYDVILSAWTPSPRMPRLLSESERLFVQ